MIIYDASITRVLFAATYRKPSRYDLKFIKCNVDGSAEATNGRVLVKAFDHHEEIEKDVFIDFDKISNIARSGSINLDLHEDKAIGAKHIFLCNYEKSWPATDRLIPRFESKLSSFTAVDFNGSLKIFQELAALDKEFMPFWAGKPGNEDGTCILIHSIPNLLVVGVSKSKDEYIGETAAYQTYLEHYPGIKEEKTESVA